MRFQPPLEGLGYDSPRDVEPGYDSPREFELGYDSLRELDGPLLDGKRCQPPLLGVDSRVAGIEGRLLGVDSRVLGIDSRVGLVGCIVRLLPGFDGVFPVLLGPRCPKRVQPPCSGADCVGRDVCSGADCRAGVEGDGLFELWLFWLLFCAIPPPRREKPSFVLRSGDGVRIFGGLLAGPCTVRFVVAIGSRAGVCSVPVSPPWNGTLVFATWMLLLPLPAITGVTCPLRAMSCCSCEAWRSKEPVCAVGVRP